MTLIEPRELEFGDSVLNFGDSLYMQSPERRSQDNVLRLGAYLLFSNRIGLPTRHLMQNSNLFSLVQWVPELLQDGLVFADVPMGCSSVTQSINTASYSKEGDGTAERERAGFLDKHSKLLHVFDATGMMARYRSQFQGDVRHDGPFRLLLQKHFGDDGLRVADALEEKVINMLPCRHDQFLESVHQVCPAYAKHLVARWASVRYYTTPMDFDVSARELPLEASALLLEAEACALTKAHPSDYLESTPEPMRSAVNVLRIGFPEVFTESDARCLINVVLKTRDAVPEARQKFADVTCRAFEEGLKEEINGVLRDELSRERLLKQGSPTLSASFKAVAADALASKVIDWATVQYAPLVGGFRAAAAPWLADQQLRAQAPWKTTCEYLGHHYQQSRILALLKPGSE